ncbi:MAG: recombination protein RecR [Lachnospiraceae bacterium]|nr:recombination protein RecR [Lachnospiraceae bacterium]
MNLYSGPINQLIDELAALPGVGEKTAQRLAFFIINLPKDRVVRLSQSLLDAREKVHYCDTCFTLTDDTRCAVCRSEKRDHQTVMVVENVRDQAAYEKTGRYEGVYHVLHGAISPMTGVGPGDLKIKELVARVGKEDVKEVILATGSSLEGETTAMYISKLLKPAGIRVTRIASGVPVGGDLEYIDEITLLRALEGRTEL